MSPLIMVQSSYLISLVLEVRCSTCACISPLGTHRPMVRPSAQIRLLSNISECTATITSATISISLFFATKGYHLNITVHAEHDLASA